MQLSQHFSYEELVASEYAARHGIDNAPPAGIHARLATLAGHLEGVRRVLLFPMHINSGYRAPALNAAIGGAVHSAHVEGWAADFICPRFGTPFDVAHAITAAKSGLEFDQLILEYGWVHISFDPQLRGQTLTKRSAAAPYVPGLLA